MAFVRPRPRAQQGFTLIELLVAISIMAVMAVLSWRGLDGMTRAQAQVRQHSDQVLTLQAGLAQWGADLDALARQPGLPSLDWDGRALRVVRSSATRADEGLTVVAWSRRSIAGVGQWLRWQSPPVTTRAALQLAWQKAGQWAQNPSDEDRRREVQIVSLDQWQIFYYRGDAWSNPLSSEGASDAGVAVGAGAGGGFQAVPDGVRLVLQLSAGQAISGKITRDWVRPGLGGGK
jgi:general secretion pathway protein J